eukprot:6172711-Pleurochrysis_carterae.AAC.7
MRACGRLCLQERRRFGAAGSGAALGMGASDLAACIGTVQRQLIDAESKRQPVDWEGMHFMVCDVLLAGCMPDEADKQVVRAYGEAWLSAAILEQSFHFYEGYRIPQALELEQHRQEIETLPLDDSPVVFGLPPRADAAFRTNRTQSVLSAMLKMQPNQSIVNGWQSRAEVVLAIAAQLLHALPSRFKQDHVQDSLHRLGPTKPLSVSLLHEVSKLNTAIYFIDAAIEQVRAALNGEIPMSPVLMELAEDLYHARVPATWIELSGLELTRIGIWSETLQRCWKQLDAWLEYGRPTTFWLGGFSNPRGFLAANAQEVCRLHARDKWALDDLVTKTEVLKVEESEVFNPPDTGVYIRGLSIEGAGWDKERCHLIDCEHASSASLLPIVWVAASHREGQTAEASMKYLAPCYKSSSGLRLNNILSIDLSTEEQPSKWILRGVAVLTLCEA